MATLHRMRGCQSTNHTECYGELWQCAQCGKTVCYAEGTDNDIDLCDDCWAQTHEPAFWREVERSRFMDTAVKMQAVITQLLAQHGMDVNESDLFLWLALPERTERLIIERIDERYLSVALAQAETLGYFTLAPQLFFVTDASGWTPIYLDGVEAVGDLTQFAEAWAERISDEGWLTQAEKLPEPPWVVNEETLWASVFEPDAINDLGEAPGEEEASCDDLPF